MAPINEVSGSPLKGFVILDFTWVVAGPQSTRLLADWGADVYRIEWPQNPDMIRFMGATPGGKTHEDVFERSGFYNDLNASKTGMTLNMNSEGGRALFRELLTKADAVIENFSPAAMEKWGFDYEAMRAINPKIIYMSISGYGHSGPSQYYLTFGPSAQALNGLTHASGLPGEEPAGWGFSYMDQTAGYVAAMAMLMAVYERERSGTGQYLDLGQSETGMALTGAAFLDSEVNGRSSRRPGFPPGNRASWPGHPVTSSYRADPTVVPHNTYRTRPAADGSDPDNDWVAISCFTDAQWRALASEMGQPGLADDARFSTLNARFDNQEELDRIIEAWTGTLHKKDAMLRLQAVGVPAGAVQSSRDRIEADEQLAHRGIYKRHGGHPLHGETLFQELPVKMTATPPAIKHHAPLMGSSNEPVLAKLLGYSPQKVRQLVDDGVLWPAGLPRPAWMKGMADEDAPEALRVAGE